MKPAEIVFIFAGIMSVAGFLMMGIDKGLSKTGARRIPEKTLMLIALIGGSPGVLIGMYLYRHKTRHAKFYIGVPLLFCLHVGICLAAAYLLNRS